MTVIKADEMSRVIQEIADRHHRTCRLHWGKPYFLCPQVRYNAEHFRRGAL